MRLSWSTDYQDYEDTKHWIPRCGELEKNILSLSMKDVLSMDSEKLVDMMEQLSELMMYYASIEDMKKLEPAMRKQEAMLKVCREKGVLSIGYWYLEMMFVRLNAQLYQNYHKNRQAVQCYQEFTEKANQCFEMLKIDVSLSLEQKTFVGWQCVDGYRAAAVAAHMILDNKMVFEIYRMVLPILGWLENYMTEFPGICDKAADFYALIAADFYTNQQGQKGAIYYEKAISILNSIWHKTSSTFYHAKWIWYQSVYGIAQYSNFEKNEIMWETEQKAKQFLQTETLQEREKGIVEGALGMTALQQSMAFQQRNETSDAIRCLTKSSDLLNEALYLLESDYMNNKGYEASIVKEMAFKVYSSSMSAQYLLGMQYYFSGQERQAYDVFIKVLTFMTNEKKYCLSTVEGMMVRADINQYLSMISKTQKELSKAEFYSTQAVELSEELAQNMGYDFAWGIYVSSCMLTAEICMSVGKKDKASEYAEKGLNACEVLKKIDSAHPKLAMQKNLFKLKKKVATRFFWH